MGMVKSLSLPADVQFAVEHLARTMERFGFESWQASGSDGIARRISVFEGDEQTRFWNDGGRYYNYWEVE
jgi:hypothetical protein